MVLGVPPTFTVQAQVVAIDNDRQYMYVVVVSTSVYQLSVATGATVNVFTIADGMAFNTAHMRCIAALTPGLMRTINTSARSRLQQVSRFDALMTVSKTA